MCCFAKNKTKAKYSGSEYFAITLAPTHEQDHKQNNPDLNNLLFLVCFTTNSNINVVHSPRDKISLFRWAGRLFQY